MVAFLSTGYGVWGKVETLVYKVRRRCYVFMTKTTKRQTPKENQEETYVVG